jgi:signal transduction histidine kinase
LARIDKVEASRDKYLRDAELELHRVSQLTSQSLRFYKQSTKPQAIRPLDMITAVIDVYATKLKKLRISLDRRDSPAAPVVCLESEIRQVISNLIRNSMDAMETSGGCLTIRSREAMDWNSERKGVLISVTDSGPGISSETMEKLYTAFFTTKGLGGTGLGLWVSSGIVQRHGGKLKARSRQGEDSGTMFTLFLPYNGLAA